MGPDYVFLLIRKFCYVNTVDIGYPSAHIPSSVTDYRQRLL